MAKMKANGANITTHPSVVIPDLVTNERIKSVVPNKYANAPDIAKANAM
jgi:hypothetical protein